MLHEIAGGDDKDPGSAGKSFYFTPQYARPIQTVRVGFASADFEHWAEPETRPVFQAALEVFKQMGVKLAETKLPEFPYGALTSTVISVEGASVFEDLIESGKVDQLADKKQIAGLRAALEISREGLSTRYANPQIVSAGGSAGPDEHRRADSSVSLWGWHQR